MGRRIFVGGLPYSVSDRQLEELFAAHGGVESARIVTDRMTGRSRGFGFVEMSSDGEAGDAIEKLNGTQFGGRMLTVSEARPRNENRFGGPPRGERRERW
jgi:RNA recognition motif-containing protein